MIDEDTRRIFSEIEKYVDNTELSKVVSTLTVSALHALIDMYEKAGDDMAEGYALEAYLRGYAAGRRSRYDSEYLPE